VKFIDFFAGIGGFRLGMEMAGHKCVGHVEIDKFANKSYQAMHNPKEGEYFADDIRNVEPGDLPEADCWCGGFPCQAFSVAGKRRGFEDMRGTLIFEVFRLAAERKPKILFLENVAGLLNHDAGKTFATILSGLWELGYDVQWQVLNSKNFGAPQNRERVFIIGHLGTGSGRKVFPIRGTNTKALKEIAGGSQGYRVYDTSGISVTLASQAGGIGATTGLYLLNGTKEGNTYCLDANYSKSINRLDKGKRTLVQVVLTPDRAEKQQNGRRMKEDGEPMFTLTAQDRHGVMIYQTPRGKNKGGFKEIAPTLSASCYENNNHLIESDLFNDWNMDKFAEMMTTPPSPSKQLIEYANKNNMKIRRLTPRECFRLQGYPDEYFDRAAKVNSDSQLYKQAGNSVTVNVIYEIAKRL